MLSSVCRYHGWLYLFYKAYATRFGKGTGDNLTVRIDMECRHQISNTLLYNLSTSVFVDEDWCSSGLTSSVHNLLSWARHIRLTLLVFLIALLREGVEDTEDYTPERKLELFSSSDELGSYPLRRLARRSAAALSSGDLSSLKMPSSSSEWLDSLLRGLNELVDWEVLTSLGTEVRVVLNEGLLSVLLRKNEWVLVEEAWGLLLRCDGTILMKSNIQRQNG